jgi:3'-phosphoadenosine 5'-phosphosulfate sulfotransferase
LRWFLEHPSRPLDPNLTFTTDKGDKTILDLALERGPMETMRLLKRFGARHKMYTDGKREFELMVAFDEKEF